MKKSIAQALFKFDLLGSSIAAEVIRRVTEPLTARLVGHFVPERMGGEESGPLGDWGAHVTVELLGHRCGFVLTCAQLRASGRLGVPANPPLPGVHLEHALAQVQVPLVAQLGRADINLDELMQLAPGDVLLLKETLDEPLRVIAPGSSLELSAHLGTFANPPQRAVRWLAS
ncbi:FliM/FliN family flagellar motor switch protein [Roseateles sp. P5_E4]